MISRDFNLRDNILEVTYLGEITIKQFIEYGNAIMKDKKLPRNLKILTDARNTTFDISYFKKENQLKLKEGMEKYLKHFTFISVALIHSTPKETAISEIFKDNFKFDNYTQKVFSTKEAALNWLKNNF